ncbi:hypothetical protein TCEA9_05050 [Thermobrachium celere]|nr:hypothetical protein TCEA9_05050 [Thermobrachium celere]
MVGKYIPIDIVKTFITIIQVVVIPLILGVVTYKMLLKKYSVEEYNKKNKTYTSSRKYMVPTWNSIYKHWYEIKGYNI